MTRRLDPAVDTSGATWAPKIENPTVEGSDLKGNYSPRDAPVVVPEPPSSQELTESENHVQAAPISTFKTNIEPLILDEVSPVPMEVIDEEAEIKVLKTPLPAVSKFNNDPVVLKARSIENPVNNDQSEKESRHLSVADASGIDNYGLPNGESVPFKELPPLQGNQADLHISFPKTNELPFEEHQKNEPTPNLEALPELSPKKDKFTSTTSFQFPLSNEIDHLFESAEPDNGAPQHSCWKEVESPTRSGSRLADKPAPPIKQVKILRLQAVTPVDQTAKFPPIAILSVVEQVILRAGIHPDVNSPIIKSEFPGPTIHARPVFDENRLEASIRGLTSRPPHEPDSNLKTIDR